MNLLDIFIIAVIGFFLVRGIFRGFIREVGSLAGVILGIWLGSVFETAFTGYLESYFPDGKYLALISFAMIFFAVLVLCNLISWGLKKLVKKLFLGWADMALGVALAVLKGVILSYFGIVLLTFFIPSKSTLITDSRLAPLVVASYQSVLGLVSSKDYEKWKKNFIGEKEKLDSRRGGTGKAKGS
ncbi:MAG TPA: CvpA family protein [Deltaproteobacteria bacterium]|nr:CvpA family protein [Deltaproteobacteria bacterium]HIJ41449.1 CvpA family protein [Deltaproteobacteria bacterium]